MNYRWSAHICQNSFFSLFFSSPSRQYRHPCNDELHMCHGFLSFPFTVLSTICSPHATETCSIANLLWSNEQKENKKKKTKKKVYSSGCHHTATAGEKQRIVVIITTAAIICYRCMSVHKNVFLSNTLSVTGSEKEKKIDRNRKK
jgi:hypothetical protein